MVVVRFLKDAGASALERELALSLSGAGFKEGLSVAVKLHMGEGKGMFSPDLARRAVSVLAGLGCRPFLVDTPVVYPGPRHFKKGYEASAALHGFTKGKIGCPIIISDSYVSFKTEHMVVEVSREVAEADALLVLSHFKGHDCAGFGGAIKNLAMGCASPKSKGDQHGLGKPAEIPENCVGCKACELACGFGAIKVSGGKARINRKRCVGCDNCVYACPHKALDAKVFFDTLLVEAASAALSFFKDKPVFYVNDLRSITKHCDCFPFPGDPVTKDVGVLLGVDIVAVEKACLDLIDRQEGKNFFKAINHHDPYIVIAEAERQKLGKQVYSLVSH